MIETSKIYIKLYAIISAIEDDITDALICLPTASIEKSKLQTLQQHQDVQQAIIESTLGEKTAALKLLIKYKLIDHTPTSALALENILPIRNRVFHRKPLEYNDFETVLSSTNTLVRKQRDLFPKATYTLGQLATDEAAFLRSVNATFEDDKSIIHNLPQADFYETGFIGHTTLRKTLLNDLIKGAYPVVTIVGEGGLGKTALALITAYDITQRTDNPFELILWTTAKRTKLIGFQIERAETAFSSGYDILSAIRSSFDESDKSNARESVVELLTQLRTLLIIDNLETVLDDDLRWLGKSVPNGSKILFTSRVQLGVGDKPIQMLPMSASDARHLFRAFAAASGLPDQASLHNNQIDEALSKLNFNPLFIKWYLQAIKSGASPTQILAKRDVIIDFCMENVFDNLSNSERVTLGGVLATKPPRSFAKLSAVTKLGGEALEDSISSLIRRNILTQTPVRESTIYEISMLAKTYAINKKIIKNTDILEYKKYERAYSSDIAKFEFKSTWSYNPKDVYIDSEDNYIAYRKVKSAGVHAARGEYDIALGKLNEAKKLSPKYFEIYRMEAWTLHNVGDYIGAVSAYEAAIELAPDNPTIRYFFADFLIRSDDFDEAVAQATIAIQIDPDAAAPKLSLARALTYIGKLEEAWNIASDLEIEGLPAQAARICADRLVDILGRQIEDAAKQQDWHRAIELIQRVSDLISTVPARHLDQGVKDKIAKQSYWIRTALRKSAKDSISKKDLDRVSLFIGEEFNRHNGENEEVKIGKIKNYSLEKRFGFITDTEGFDHFFHITNTINTNPTTLQEGLDVRFILGKNDQGSCADHVEIVPPP
jgi:LuxR family glucitol operon transcriptional activator